MAFWYFVSLQLSQELCETPDSSKMQTLHWSSPLLLDIQSLTADWPHAVFSAKHGYSDCYRPFYPRSLSWLFWLSYCIYIYIYMKAHYCATTEMDKASQVQILDKAICILLSQKYPWETHDSISSPPPWPWVNSRVDCALYMAKWSKTRKTLNLNQP